jgi:hypothetical protein
MEAFPAVDPQAGWRSTVRDARAQIEEVLRESPSLRRRIDATIAEPIGIAAGLAEDDLARHGEAAEKIRARLKRDGFSAEQVLGDWFPDPAD